jgi:phage terminase Nu1 subunit (DNA packaging protein)
LKSNGNHSKVIIGISELAAILSVSEPTVKQYLKMGMPGVKIGGAWHFHIENINLWFQKITAVKPDENFDLERAVNPKKA